MFRPWSARLCSIRFRWGSCRRNMSSWGHALKRERWGSVHAVYQARHFGHGRERRAPIGSAGIRDADERTQGIEPTTVSCCVAEVRPVAEAVTVGVPASVSLYLKLTVLVPPGSSRL